MKNAVVTSDRSAEQELDLVVGELEAAVPPDRKGAWPTCRNIYCTPYT